MTPERWEQIEALFHEALSRPPHQREGFLRQATLDDEPLRRSVNGMLSDHLEEPDFLDTSASRIIGRDRPVEDPGTQSGELEGDPALDDFVPGWRLVRTIGSGGMGDVYLARRAHEELEDQVAIKVVRGVDPRGELDRRFRAERAILSRFSHSNIARLLDAGLTNNGQLYYVMEYVDGVPITQFCESTSAGLEERIALFRRVCEAVQYAHAHLVVHRDIKPANVLVTGDGTPKLLDFGIAKVLDPFEESDLTRTGAHLMTPEYASPEQVLGQPVSTASDVYSLGVLLYELLSGVRPYDLGGRTAAEIEQVVAEVVPPPPSGAEAETGRGIHGTIPPDVQTITQKALEKDPNRRYASVQQLSEDLERWQQALPIIARPATLRYRATRFVQRHRVGVAAGSAIAILLVGGSVATGIQATMISRRAQQVEEERDRVQRVLDLLTGVYQSAEPNVAKGTEPTVQDLLATGSRRFEGELAQDPVTQSDMFTVIAEVYNSLGLSREADTLHRRALDLRRAALGPNDPKVATSLGAIGNVRRAFGDYDEAISLYRQALSIAEHSSQPDLVAGLRHHLGYVHHDAGRLEEARNEYVAALEMATTYFGTDHEVPARIRFDLGWALDDLGELDLAEQHYRTALAVLSAKLGEEHTDVAKTLKNLGLLLRQRGDYESAESMLRSALSTNERLLGRDHRQFATTATALGLLLVDLNRFDEGVALLSEALGTYQRTLGENHSYTATLENNIGSAYRKAGDLARAEPRLRKALDTYRSLFGEAHPNVAAATVNLAGTVADLGRLEEAQALYERALEIDRNTVGDSNRFVASDLAAIAGIEARRGRVEQARTLYEEAVSMYAASVPDGTPSSARAQVAYAALLAEEGLHERAARVLRQAVATRLRSFGRTDSRTAEAALDLAASLVAIGDSAEADSLLQWTESTFRDNPDQHAEQLRRIRSLRARL